MAPGTSAENLRQAKKAFEEHAYGEAEKLCKEALAAVDKGMTGDEAKRMRAEIFSLLADIKNIEGAWVDSIFYQDVVSKTWFDLGNNKKGTESLIKSSMALTRKGKQAEALAGFQKAHDIARKHGNQLLIGRALAGICAVNLRQGKYAEGIKLAEQAISIGQKEGDFDLQGFALGMAADTRSQQGDYTDSIAKYKLAIAALEKTDNHYDLERNLSNLGETYMIGGDYKEAIKVLEKARDSAQKHQNKRTLGHILNNLTLSHFKNGDVMAAKNYAEQANVILAPIEDKYAKSYLQMAWGLIHASLGENQKSLACFEKAVLWMRELNVPYDTGIILLEKGRTLAKQRQTDEARTALSEAIVAFKEADAKTMISVAEKEMGAIK